MESQQSFNLFNLSCLSNISFFVQKYVCVCVYNCSYFLALDLHVCSNTAWESLLDTVLLSKLNEGINIDYFLLLNRLKYTSIDFY